MHGCTFGQYFLKILLIFLFFMVLFLFCDMMLFVKCQRHVPWGPLTNGGGSGGVF